MLTTRNQQADNYRFTERHRIYIKPEDFQAQLVVMYPYSDLEWYKGL